MTVRHFRITVSTDVDDPVEVMRAATEMIATQIDFGGQNTTSIELTERFPDEADIEQSPPEHLAGYEMEPED